MHSPNLNMNDKTLSQVLAVLSPGSAAGPHLPLVQAGGQGGVDAAEVVLDAGALVGRPEVTGGGEASFISCKCPFHLYQHEHCVPPSSTPWQLGGQGPGATAVMAHPLLQASCCSLQGEE